MSPDIIKEWGGAVAVILSIGGIIYAWLTRRSKENTETIKAMGADLSSRIKVIEKKQVDYDRRIQRLEDDSKHLPTREQISELKVALAQVSTTVDNTNKLITRLENDIRAIQKDK